MALLGRRRQTFGSAGEGGQRMSGADFAQSRKLGFTGNIDDSLSRSPFWTRQAI